MASAYEDALRSLRLANRSDPLTDLVARRIIELAQQGEHDADELQRRALRMLSDQGQHPIADRAGGRGEDGP